ncbi:MAG: hypothetical protein AAGE52_17565 [Myxococcota bacterium]
MRRSALLALLVACGGGEQTAPPPVLPGPPEPTTEAAPAEASPRALGATATFADLVAAARRLDDRGEGESTAGCLLRGTGETGASWRLEADLAVGVRPLPNPTGLAPRLGGDEGAIRILSRWGQRGTGSLSVAVFTTLPPPRPGAAILVAITDDGVHLRSTEGELPRADRGPHRVSELAPVLERVAAPGGVYVTAEPGTSLGRLRQILALVGAAPVGLAVVLADGVTLPEAPRGAAGEGLCEDGLTATTEAEGTLETDRIVASLGPLTTAGATCMTRANPEAARGGRMEIAIRIAAGGTVGEACAVSDALGDPQLRACVLRAVRDLRFPDPGGVLDVVLPISLAPDRSERPRPLCR